MNSFKSIIINLFIPLFVAIVFASLVFYQAEIPTFFFSISKYAFYVLIFIVMGISWQFNRNRFIFVLVPLLLIFVGFEFLSPQKATLLFKYVSILFPLHLLIFLLLRERGLFSIWGYLKILFLVLEIGLVLWLIEFPQEIILEIFKIKLFVLSTYPLSHISVGVAILSIFILLALSIFNHYLIYNTSFLVILLSFFGGLYFVKFPHATELSFITIVFIVLVLLIRESYRLAFFDELTALPGRRALVEDMAKLGRKYTLAMIDIDFFKKFNDTYGHDTGDEVLKMVATKLAEVSGGGKAYRYGGEEFVVLFNAKEVSESFLHVDSLRLTIANSAFMVRNKKSTKNIYINISAGIVQNKSNDKDPFATMKRADNALYKAKKAGRNKVIKA